MKTIEHFAVEFRRYRDLADKAMAQVPDDALNRVPGPDANSIAMIVRHISGNLRSRFTDFLTTDGEKPWRDRDSEFVDAQLGALTDAHLQQTVTIRGVPATVQEALCRATAHVAYHAGQIVLLCRMYGTDAWTSLSIPKRK
jgi:uncharacterized damage-inducible protein DinB